ncbi:uncharacterized protein LOC143055457 [Mytilus galloprovincialis]|uniref:uncharacterized protein LOC143055457 n=1 Tax=Mytilus galloprovincialis TaxID=29158 RepID=UPI003F7B77CD
METDSSTKRSISDDENVNIITLRSRDGTELYTSSDCSGYPAAMPMPVDDDETFVKNIDNDNDDNDLPTGGAATEKKILLVAQQTQEKNTDTRSNDDNQTLWIDADVHVNISAMPPMLSENPANDDSGRFLPNGGNSMPMQYQKGNADANNPMVDKTVVKKSETFSSD